MNVDAEGQPRRVGFELELSGLLLDQTLDALQAALGGEREALSAAERALEAAFLDAAGHDALLGVRV